MRRIFNRIYFARKYGAYVDSAAVGRRCVLGHRTHVKAQSVLRSVTLGAGCYVNRGAEVYQADIGPFCSIGHLAQIGPNEHLTDEMSTCNGLYGTSLASKLAKHNMPRTTVGADVWIGSRSIILRGTRIGTGAIIAAGAVVVEDVPDYAIVVGVPGRVVRKRFSEQTIENLCKSRWWERAPEDITRALEEAAGEDQANEKAKRFLMALADQERAG